MKESKVLKIGFIVLFIGVILFGIGTACTQNQKVKMFGGKMTYDIPANHKLINATWKEEDLWVLTRPMRADEKPETFKFSEKSSFGIMEGEITFVETKTQ